MLNGYLSIRTEDSDIITSSSPPTSNTRNLIFSESIMRSRRTTPSIRTNSIVFISDGNRNLCTGNQSLLVSTHIFIGPYDFFGNLCYFCSRRSVDSLVSRIIVTTCCDKQENDDNQKNFRCFHAFRI